MPSHHSFPRIVKKGGYLLVLVVLCVASFYGQVSAYTQQDISSFYNNTPFYDPAEQGCTAGSNSSGPIVGDIKSLAQQILDNKSISYDGGPSGSTGTQFKRLANGQKAQTDDGREVDTVQPIVLVTILHIAQSHKLNISALTDGSSHASPTNPHGSGRAVDINILDGNHTNGTDSVADAITSSAAEVLPNGSRLGLGSNGGVQVGPKSIGGKSFTSFVDNPNHVHIDVQGVSQTNNDAAVQAAGVGGSSSPASSGCCALNAASATQLTGSNAGEMVFNYFLGKNLSADSAAAATGNLEIESGFKPDVWGGGNNNYYGLAQWSRNDRYPNLVSFAGGAENAAKLDAQLNFVWHELTNGYKSTLANLQGNGTVQEKAIFWGRNYEGAVNPDKTLQAEAERVAAAIKWSVKAGGNVTAPGSNTAGPVSLGGCSSSSTHTSGSYSNPFHSTDGLVASRIDEGVDYASTKPVPLYAIGNGMVTQATDQSTFFKTKEGHADWITYQLTDGPAAGKFVYIAEACPPLVHIGDVVTPDTHLCDVLPDSVEMGWALDATSQVAAAYYDYHGHDGYETAYGANFNQLLVKLGAPSGHLDTASDPSGEILGGLPAGWPSW